jgi:iron only hydrogenase large subunit-like protein
MKKEKTLSKLIPALKNQKVVAMIAPSFVVDFHYPSIISELKQLGFDKVVELTFGAKMINREYHKLLFKSQELVISSTCPAIIQAIKSEFPQYENNISRITSPMAATAKICRHYWPEHKTCFISPCHMKKIEAENYDEIDYVIDFQQLKSIIIKRHIAPSNKKEQFDKFYNDYTKIYPLSGGLTKTAHFRGIVKRKDVKILDGWKKIQKLLKSKKVKKYRFLDVTFCKGGCIGGPCTSQFSLRKKKKLVMDYIKKSKHENIPENKKGLVEKAKEIIFTN